VPCGTSPVVPGAHRVVGPSTHRGSGPREVHTTGSSLLSHWIWGHEASGTEAGERRGDVEVGERRGATEVGKATARGPEDSSPPAFSASSFSLAGAWGRWNGWGPPVGARTPWLCRQNRCQRRCPYTLFRCRDSYSCR
jgi:hypothetical protein